MASQKFAVSTSFKRDNNAMTLCQLIYYIQAIYSVLQDHINTDFLLTGNL